MKAQLHCLAALALLLAFVPPVQADVEDLLPPQNLQGTPTASHTIHLTWLPPGNDTTTAFLYTVYRNGEAVGTTTQTWFDATLPEAANVFYVTASTNDAQSAPSNSMLVQQTSGGPNPWLLLGPTPPIISGCEITGIWTFTHYPFVSVTIHEQCIPIIGKLIHLPPPAMLQGEGA